MNFKPGDLLFGIVDLFAFLVPGSILLITLPLVSHIHLNYHCFLDDLSKYNISGINTALFILMSYIAGHFVHSVSALAFKKLCLVTYLKHRRNEYAYFIADAKQKLAIKFPVSSSPERMADAYIRQKQPSLIIDIEKHVATSKLFRSISLLCLYLCFYPKIGWGILFLLLFSVLAFYRFAQQKWREELLTYEFVIILMQLEH